MIGSSRCRIDGVGDVGAFLTRIGVDQCHQLVAVGRVGVARDEEIRCRCVSEHPSSGFSGRVMCQPLTIEMPGRVRVVIEDLEDARVVQWDHRSVAGPHIDRSGQYRSRSRSMPMTAPPGSAHITSSAGVIHAPIVQECGDGVGQRGSPDGSSNLIRPRGPNVTIER